MQRAGIATPPGWFTEALAVPAKDGSVPVAGARISYRAWGRPGLPGVVLVVPGNHDVPLWDVVSRFTRPLHRYRRHLTPDLAPFFHQEDLAVMGVNTARSWTFKNGRISWEQIEQIRNRFAPLPERVFKVLVTHHPFDLPGPDDGNERVGRAKMAMASLRECMPDLLLAGHVHLHGVGTTAESYELGGRSAIVVQAGTATSTRRRGTTNSTARKLRRHELHLRKRMRCTAVVSDQIDDSVRPSGFEYRG